ncbi:hypothetical protein [Pumilibacter muris]|uniref:hypothetical protein n=1 Tax=Pumilibacter muris TaxID=2941510 RepID=UPI00203F5A9A|nr:hypothetical protein [Pumilibacter muris]
MQQDIDNILYKMGYYDADPQLKETVKGYIKVAEEFMLDSGVPQDRLGTQRAYAIKALFADAFDKGTPDDVIKKDGMVVALIAQLRR